MLEFSARIRRVSAYMPVTLTGGVKKLVLEGVARAKYDSYCCFFCERLSARLGAHEPQAYRVHAPVVNTAYDEHARECTSVRCTGYIFNEYSQIYG